MPYKDPQRKREWEWRHRGERLARRRELRQIESAWKEAHPEALRQDGGAGFLIPLVAGGALAAYNPKLAIGAGGLTLVIAATHKKGWSWWGSFSWPWASFSSGTIETLSTIATIRAQRNDLVFASPAIVQDKCEFWGRAQWNDHSAFFRLIN